ncbi:hypothetical protein I5192_06935 [Ruegeria sp. SCSIO 43209]|uniref:hypothetical protein n=1 Tax=Ruegeria sp. SCSIO 43209 TaxID=2793010 RepID=UPI001CAA29A2|nr:hypothetical protein [Ruegeria sp. SCSIO 43209]UAB90389.1 hypothetical protein I5192_06935 [Ruegeria sp. SCSIO 43209]
MVGFLEGAGIALSAAQGIKGLFGGKGDRLDKSDTRWMAKLNDAFAKKAFNRARQGQKQWELEKWGLMRKGMEKAGFNPLGGAPDAYSGGGSSAVTGGVMSSKRINHLAAASDTLLGVEALQAERAGLELERQRLEKANEEHKLNVPDGGIYQRGSNAQGDHDNSGGTVPAGGNLRVGGGDFELDRDKFDDAEKFEQRYGDLLGSIIGIPIAGADAVKNFKKWVEKEGQRRSKLPELGTIKGPRRPKARPKRKSLIRAPKWGTPEYTEHMRKLYP